jgi:hypothetical protein
MTPPRFQRTSLRGNELSLREPLAPVVASLPELEERVAHHGKVVAELDKRQRDVIEARRYLEETKAKHVAAVEEAALEGKEPPKARQGGAAEKRVERAEEELRSFEGVLERSADRLLVFAFPLLPRAHERVLEERERRLARATELKSALDTELAGFQALADDERWIEAASNGGRAVDPFSAAGGDPEIFRLRGTIAGAFDGFLARRDEREAEAERNRRWQEENRDEWERRAEAAAAAQAAQRVVVEDGVIVERGGKPVRKGAFGYEPVEEEET